MSDLNPTPRDHAPPVFPRKTGRLAARADRAAIARDRAWGLLAALWLCACVREAPAPIAPAPERPALWVDGAARPGGDGSRERPLKQVPAELPEQVALHLSTGLYEGPFAFPAGARVEGHGEVVLHAAAPAVVVRGDGLTLVHLSVQGGDVGLEVSGQASLERVHVSGHRKVGVEVLPGARVDAAQLEVVGTIAEAVGVHASRATLHVTGASFTGDLRQGFKLEGGAAVLTGAKSEGGNTLLNARDADVTLERANAVAGRGPAVFLSGGTARVDGLVVDGHESALHTLHVTGLDARHVRATRPSSAGVVLQGTTGTVRDVGVARTGPGGGVQLLDSDVTLEDATVREAGAMGVFVRKGKARLERVSIEGVDGESDGAGGRVLGDALMLRDAVVDVDEVTVRDVEGAALFASAFATVTVGRLSCERTGEGLAYVERGAVVKARELTARGTMGAAVLVPDQARLEVETLVIRGAGEGPVFANCAAGASVTIGALDTTLEPPDAPCVKIGRRVKPTAAPDAGP